MNFQIRKILAVLFLMLIVTACGNQKLPDDWWRNDNGASMYFYWGYDVSTPGSPMGILNEDGFLVRTTQYNGDPLAFTVNVQTNSDEAIHFGFMVLVDGIPVKFSIADDTDAGKESYMHPFIVDGKAVYKTLIIDPDFSDKTGQVHIIIITNIMNENGNFGVIPIFVSNYSETSEPIVNPVRTRSLYEDFANSPEEGETLVHWWLHSQDAPEEMRQWRSSIDSITLSSDGYDWLFESTSGLSGKLRTVFFLDYEPFPVINDKPFVDWNLEYNQMLSLPIAFPDIEQPAMFFAVTIRQDDEMKYDPMILNRVLIYP
ncbi:MAG: hypothetical protein FWH17_05180 [Oscillospiraceae bacterium]|nr:hypothetical protein [Oscillospiraceae bacterium]